MSGSKNAPGLRRAGAAGLAVAACGVAIPAAIAAPSADRGSSPTIKVSDNEFSKSRLAVRPGTEVTYKWDGDNSNPHNVILRDGPNGINKKEFRSKTGVTDVNFSPKYRKPGVYKMQCIIHPDDMNLKVDVRKK